MSSKTLEQAWADGDAITQELAFPSKFLNIKAVRAMPGEQITGSIRGVLMEEVGGQRAEHKLVLYVAGEQRGLILNKENLKLVTAITHIENARDLPQYEGQITIWFDPLAKGFGDQMGGVRIRQGPEQVPVVVEDEQDEE